MEKLNKKIIFVAGLHGNEKMPVHALVKAGIDFVLGNPRAYEKNVRYTEQDLNASFGTRNKSFESKRAAEMLKEIDKDNVVVDFHTTESEKTPFVILVDKKLVPLAQRTGIRRVVLMKHNIKKGHALINYRDGISIEAGTHKDKRSFNITLDVVKKIKENKKYPITLYEVFGKISRSGKYVNFKPHPDGFIPILANESEYEKQGLFGLKSTRIYLQN